MEYHLKQHQEDTKLPVVFPMLFYQEQQDKRPYPYSLDILDLFADRIFAEQTLAKPAHLIDITTFSDDDIKKHKLISLLEFLLKHSRDRDLLLIMNDLKQIIIDVCNKTCNDENLLAFYIEYNLYYIINVGNVKDRNEFINQLEMIPVIKEKIMGSIMRSLAREFKAEAKAEGKAEGRAEGEKEKSQSIAINMLKKGLPINTIAEVTELPMFEIMNLQKNNLPHKLDA